MASGAAGVFEGLAKEQFGLIIGIGVGSALAAALEPQIVAIRQAEYDGDPLVAVEPGVAAAIVAEAVELAQWGRDEARKYGVDEERFDAIVGEVLNAPGAGDLLRMARRGTITADDFLHGLRKSKLETRWDAQMVELQDERVEPGEIAKAIHRGIMRGDGLLVVEPPNTPGNVPAVPPSPLDPVKEAAAAGLSHERLRILVGNAGLPPGAVQMLELLNRGGITEADFLRGVGESNLRNEWGQALLGLRRRILTPHEYVEARVRAWIDDAAMHAGAALSGMEAADTDLLFKIQGRPLSWHQVFIGERRGGKYEGDTSAIDAPFLKALEESNIRPEWYSLAWAQRYSYPSAFVLRQLTTSGELTTAEVEQILLYEGWEPGLAKKVSARWGGSVAGAGKQETLTELEDEYAGGYVTEAELRASLTLLGYTGNQQDLLVHLNDARRIKRWREKVVDAIAAAYLGFKIDDATASSELAEVNVTGEASTLMLTLWGKQRRFTIRELTEAQVKKAHKSGLFDRPTALAALEDLHLTPADAATFLDE